MNKFIQNFRNPIKFFKQETHVIEEDLECEVTDEIERALWILKEEMDLPTEEVEKAVKSRSKKNISFVSVIL
jgi:CRISPR/Cas system Type II protein with McrA/HNH and RuvC-like nuclease domain